MLLGQTEEEVSYDALNQFDLFFKKVITRLLNDPSLSDSIFPVISIFIEKFKGIFSFIPPCFNSF